MYSDDQVLKILLIVDAYIQDSEGSGLHAALHESWDGKCHTSKEVLDYVVRDLAVCILSDGIVRGNCMPSHPEEPLDCFLDRLVRAQIDNR